MKQFAILALLCLGTFSFAQKKEYDKKMIGCFKGSEVNQQIQGF